MAVSKRLVLAALVLVPAAAACQLVLGLDEYSADGGVAGIDAAVDADGSDGSDGSVLPDVFAQKAEWAKWHMPNPSFTPQKPADAGPSDANYNFATFGSIGSTSNDSGTYGVYSFNIDVDAGRIGWMLDPPITTTASTFAEASALCAARGGRLPTRIELVTLVDFARQGSDHFVLGGPDGGLLPQRYWSSSLVRPYNPDNGVRYWGVSFGGNDLVTEAAQGDRVVCVVTQ